MPRLTLACARADDLPWGVAVSQVGPRIAARRVVAVDDLPPGVLCALVRDPEPIVYARASIVRKSRARSGR